VSDDFHRLDALVTAAAATEPLTLSDAASTAHREEDTPGEAVTDPTLLEELFG
jgi:hypothetical protein